jgi:hypothetical protein
LDAPTKSATNGAWTAVDLLWRAHLLEHAGVHDRNSIGHRERLALVVGDVAESDPHRSVEILQLSLQFRPQLEVERTKRLVEEQYVGSVDERPSERHTLLLSPRELARASPLAPLQPDQTDRFLHPRRDLGARPSSLTQSEGHVLPHVEMREQRVTLKHRVDRAVIRTDACYVAPAHADLAGSRSLKSGDHAQRCGLSAARRADDREELALLNVQVQFAHGDQVAIVLPDSDQTDGGGVGRHP